MLEHIFGSKTRVKLLQLFLRSPERSFYVREIARAAGMQLNAVRRELANLEKISILLQVPVVVTEKGDSPHDRSKYFRANTQSVVFHELQALLMKAEVLEQNELVDSLERRAGRIKLLVFTGLFTQAPEAGTDMLLVGTVRESIVASIIAQFEKTMGYEVRYTIMEEREYLERREIGDKFLYNVFEARHVVALNKITPV